MTDTPKPKSITIEQKHDGKVIMAFPEGVHLNHLTNGIGVEVILTRSQWNEFTTAYTELMISNGVKLLKTLKDEFLSALRDGAKGA